MKKRPFAPRVRARIAAIAKRVRVRRGRKRPREQASGGAGSTFAPSCATGLPFASDTFTELNVGSRSSLNASRNVSGPVSTVPPVAGVALSSLPCAEAATGAAAISAPAAAKRTNRVSIVIFVCIFGPGSRLAQRDDGQRAVSNLASNALEHAETGSTIELTVSTRPGCRDTRMTAARADCFPVRHAHSP